MRRLGRRRALLLVASGCLVLSCGSAATYGGDTGRPVPRAGAATAPTAAGSAGPRASTPKVGRSVWVTVAVATLWTSPTAPRPVDAKAVGAPVDIRGWLAAMSTAVRRGLAGRVETQALYGDRLRVTGIRTGWLHVLAVGQPTGRDPRGYPGWVPASQTTARSPVATSQVATVTRLTTWLRNASGHRAIQLSIGTRLPVLGRGSTVVSVATPTHGRLFAAAADVVLRSPAAAALARSAGGVVATARAFLGRPYLWGGRSGFAVDCSGLTQLAYALHGVVIPRDAQDQATAGQPAALTSLRPGVLLFFRVGSAIGHVGMYVGGGRMLHAPRTGTPVQVADMGRPALARRFL